MCVATPTNVEFNCEFFFKGPTTIRNQILYCPRMQRKVGNGCQVQLGEGSFLWQYYFANTQEDNMMN